MYLGASEICCSSLCLFVLTSVTFSRALLRFYMALLFFSMALLRFPEISYFSRAVLFFPGSVAFSRALLFSSVVCYFFPGLCYFLPGFITFSRALLLSSSTSRFVQIWFSLSPKTLTETVILYWSLFFLVSVLVSVSTGLCLFVPGSLHYVKHSLLCSRLLCYPVRISINLSRSLLLYLSLRYSVQVYLTLFMFLLIC